MIDVSAIPDFPAAKQLARALWQDGSTLRQAACLVGAGFSRNASRAADDTPHPPLWPDLVYAMKSELYPDGAKGAPSEALRLAEEYRTYLGQAALDDLVRAMVPDDAWQPGPAHATLLNLPWADVLTTNWDTLLERAARKVASRSYSVIKSCADLGHARAPRIVKLHGTIGTSDHFVLAEEDYRRYPTRFAPFVNLARQVFIENELVLLGFSGDDPNFLQWSGWVRDQLGSAARRIYLVGVLDLGPAKRKLLESMNVAPIDLAPLVADEPDAELRHTRATTLFLDMLASFKPTSKHEWRLSSDREPASTTREEWERRQKDDAHAASVIERAAAAWRLDRQNYPGWLVCPAAKRHEIGGQTMTAHLLTAARLALVAPERRLSVLYEIAWRYKTAFWLVPDYLRKLFAAAVEHAQSQSSLHREHLEIAALLMRAARLSGDDAGFETWAGMIEAHAAPEYDLHAEVAYQRALRARDRLDFAGVLAQAATIGAGRDPAWRLRLASLHSWRGEFEEAGHLIAATVAELNDRQAEDRTSIWLRSRRAWAQWLARAVQQGRLLGTPIESWPFEFREIQCDPWDEIDGIRDDVGREVRDRLEKKGRIQPLFLPGHYRDRSTTVTIGSAAATPAHTLDFLSEIVGLPERFDHSNLTAATAKDVVELALDPEDASAAWYRRWLRVVYDHSDPGIDRYFSRVGVAQMAPEVAQKLVVAVTSAVRYWRERVRRIRQAHDRYDTFAVERLRFFVEILARLTARQQPSDARQSFMLAADLAADTSLRHMWLREQVVHLAEYALGAMPASDRTDLVLEVLDFPLPGEWAAGYPGYASPLSYLLGVRPERPPCDTRWTSRIATLIEETTREENRAEACLRLIYLAEHSALTEGELETFSRALWSQVDDGVPPLPRDTRLYPHVFTLAVIPGIDAQGNVRLRIFGPAHGASKGGYDPFNAITAAALAARPLLPSREQAIRIYDQTTKWRPAPVGDALTSAITSSNSTSILRALGPAIAKGLLPALDPSDLTVERGRALLLLIDEASAFSAIWALPYFIRGVDDDDSKNFAHRIRRGLLSRHLDELSGAALAINAWTDLAVAGRTPPPPAAVVEQVCANLESLPGLGFDTVLRTARRLVEARFIPEACIPRISAALEVLLIGLAYERLSVDDEAAVTVSLARAECVRLAAALKEAGVDGSAISAWLDVTASDPLPEVRFAMATFQPPHAPGS